MRRSPALLSIAALLLLISYVSASQVVGSVSVTVISSIPNLFLSNTLIDQGQSILFSAQTSTGDIGPFTYNYQIINTITNSVVANQLYTGVSSPSNSFFWTPPSNDLGNTIEVNVITTDSNSVTLNSVYSPIGYNSASTITLTPYASSLISGQTETFTFQESGGTGGVFNVELYNVTGSAQQGSNVVILGVGGSTILSFQVSATGTFIFNAIATDTGTTTPFVFNSTDSTIIVNFPVTTTTISNGGGGGGGSPGPGGGGGSSKPVETKLANGCLLVTNIAVPNSFNLTFNGSKTGVTESFIAPNFTSVIVNGQTYSLYLNAQPTEINGRPVTLQLVNISYEPIEHTVSIEGCSTGHMTTVYYSPLPQVVFTYVPAYTSLVVGGNYSTQLGIKDTSDKPEYINLSIGGNFSNLASLYTSMLYLQPGQSVGAQLKFSAPSNLAPGIYIIPVNVNISVVNSKILYQKEFLTLIVYNYSSSQPGILNQISIINYTNSSGEVASGTIEIIAPPKTSLFNATLETTLPLPLVANLSDISTYGLPSNIISSNGTYSIYWHIKYLGAKQVTYAYYTIKNPLSQPTLERIQNILGVPSPSSTQFQSTLRIINISIPTFYTTSTNHIYLQALYTGTQAGNVNFTIVAPSGVTVYNGVILINATPNQYLTNNFVIETDGYTGTMVLTLYVTANGQTTTYTLPVIIMQKESQSSIYTNELLSSSYLYYAIAAAVTLVFAGLIYRILKARRIRRYSPRSRTPPKEEELEDVKSLLDGDSGKGKGDTDE